MSKNRKRVTYRQEDGDDGYCYVVRVDGRKVWDGLTRREAMYYRDREVAELDKPGRQDNVQVSVRL